MAGRTNNLTLPLIIKMKNKIKKLNYELIELYKGRIRTLWIFKFSLILVFYGVGHILITEILKYDNDTFLFFLGISFFSIGIFLGCVTGLVSFFNDLISTKRKLKLALEEEK